MDFMTGRHFLQIPGPTNVPDRVLRAMARPTIDHRGPEFSRLALEVIEGLKQICKTAGSIVIYPSSGTGAWEAALVNTLSPGDKILMVETGHFATLWRGIAIRFGLDVDFIPTDWRHGANPPIIEEKLSQDREHKIRLWPLCRMKRQQAWPAESPKSAKPSTGHLIRRCFWLIPSLRSHQLITVMMNGALM
jgi:aspartate aminotransferase-like enzyme